MRIGWWFDLQWLSLFQWIVDGTAFQPRQPTRSSPVHRRGRNVWRSSSAPSRLASRRVLMKSEDGSDMIRWCRCDTSRTSRSSIQVQISMGVSQVIKVPPVIIHILMGCSPSQKHHPLVPPWRAGTPHISSRIFHHESPRSRTHHDLTHFKHLLTKRMVMKFQVRFPIGGVCFATPEAQRLRYLRLRDISGRLRYSMTRNGCPLQVAAWRI